MIELHSVHVRYQQDSAALKGISLKIPKGDFVFLTGPSGAGKTTLLKLLYGAVMPSQGQIIVDGQNIARLGRSQLPFYRRTLGVVFQDFKLLQNRTVMENVSVTLEVLGWSKNDCNKKVYHTLKQLGVETKQAVCPSRLSGGEQQRVALARALVNDPKILLADEPTGNLDDANKEQILQIFKDANIRGTTVVIASHDQRLMSLVPAARVIRLKGGALEDDGVSA